MQFFGCKKGGRALPAFRADGGTRRKDWIQMSQLKGACIIGQSGGHTSVINASAYGAIKTALENESITRVLGALNGIKGVLDDNLIDMGKEDPAELALMKHTPSSALAPAATS